ncbi:hypothetical protein [Psychroserpens luteolus]|uniref:hypothetical protein n=1 Tax=Psychroserpens luteolus TaxID=2855840 RepID=UPI001E3788A0|nr:hypothetical protein [Psychroserpens luteolus]MCD2257589.1 hypothetical protein [Psychroserpens luteolus]
MKLLRVFILIILTGCTSTSAVKSTSDEYNLRYFEEAQQLKSEQLRKLVNSNDNYAYLEYSYLKLFKYCRDDNFDKKLFEESTLQSIEYMNFPDFCGYYWNDSFDLNLNSIDKSYEKDEKCKPASESKIPFIKNLIDYFKEPKNTPIVVEDNQSRLLISEVENKNEYNKGVYIYSKFKLSNGKIISHEVKYFKLIEEIDNVQN